jgi:hypothetical protein
MWLKLAKIDQKWNFSIFLKKSHSFLYLFKDGYQVKSRAQKVDGQKADINNPINQKAEMKKTDMSKRRQSKSQSVKKPIFC